MRSNADRKKRARRITARKRDADFAKHFWTNMRKLVRCVYGSSQFRRAMREESAIWGEIQGAGTGTPTGEQVTYWQPVGSKRAAFPVYLAD